MGGYGASLVGAGALGSQSPIEVLEYCLRVYLMGSRTTRAGSMLANRCHIWNVAGHDLE